MSIKKEPLIPGQRFCFKKHLKLQRRRINRIILKSDSRVFMVAFMDSLEKLHIPEHFLKKYLVGIVMSMDQCVML